MSVPNSDLIPSSAEERRRQFTASLPMRTALLAVAAVWLLGAVWSYTEQSAFAANKGFAFPHLLPLVIDGFAIAMAGVAWAASLDARPAVAARLATVVAVCASSASNGAWAYIRTQHDLTAVLLGVAVPIAANLAFEVLLAELRRQVQRRRGLPPPVAIPYPRLIRLGLAPWSTFIEWRAMVLDLTRMEHTAPVRPGSAPAARPTAEPAVPAAAEAVDAAVPSGAGTRPSPPAQPKPRPRNPAQPRTAAQPRAAARPKQAAQPKPAARPKAPVLPEPVLRLESVGRPTSVIRPDSEVRPGAVPQPEPAVRPEPAVHPERPATPTPEPARTPTPAASDRGHAERRSVDPRVEMLAAHLAAIEDSGEFTGDMVGPLLGIEVAPRTGRRLLGQARELVAEHQNHTDRHDAELRVIGAG